MELNAIPLPRFFELRSASPFAYTIIKAQRKFLRLLPRLFHHSLLSFILQRLRSLPIKTVLEPKLFKQQ